MRGKGLAADPELARRRQLLAAPEQRDAWAELSRRLRRAEREQAAARGQPADERAQSRRRQARRRRG